MYIESGVKGQTRGNWVLVTLDCVLVCYGKTNQMLSFRSFPCSHIGVLKLRSHAGLEPSSGKTQRGRERLVSPVSRFLLYHQCPSDVISKVFSQSCKSSVSLQFLLQKFQFHNFFNCVSLLTCHLSVHLTSKSCQVGNSRLNLSLAVGTVNSEKDHEKNKHQFSVLLDLRNFRSCW